jgi:hypothetical protein
MMVSLVYTAHFAPEFALRAHRTEKYGSLTVLNSEANCTRVRKTTNAFFKLNSIIQESKRG